MSIKHLKPRTGKKSRFKQGYFNVEKSKKYVGPRPVIYRSSFEYRFCVHCENNDNIVEWSSEPFPIKYVDYLGKQRNYYIDFVVKYRNGSKWLIEVKPYAQTIAQNNKTYKINAAKWTAAKTIGESLGYKFTIVTEKTLKHM